MHLMLDTPTIFSNGAAAFIFQSCRFVCATTRAEKALLGYNSVIPFKDYCFFSRITLKKKLPMQRASLDTDDCNINGDYAKLNEVWGGRYGLMYFNEKPWELFEIEFWWPQCQTTRRETFLQICWHMYCIVYLFIKKWKRRVNYHWIPKNNRINNEMKESSQQTFTVGS